MTIDKNKAKAKDLRKLKGLLKLIPAERKPIAEKLIEELAFMYQTITELKNAIEEKGVLEHFKQGAQEFMRVSPALKAYNTTIQRYNLLCKHLVELLPKAEPSDKAKDELLDFLQKM